MGKVKKKPLPTLDKNPVDGDKLIKATKPKKVKKTNEVEVNIAALREDLDKLGVWIADVEDCMNDMNKLLLKLANRMGF